ncbi:hypothetical protein DFH07DRAFT_771976 [Mycena maculata]|uniref:C2H2-type domain-containing protein n=1 Tax=Mycena maculata TaxID=230809 RepID=A0AAD7NH53_9AGAR|nr:hypothetical protein DFH07DRAFT_771976 [Mycena maculata]
MDSVDIEKPIEDELAEKSTTAVQERQSQEAESSTPKTDDIPTDTETPENPSVPPLRPLTRSLTGRASKPRARDDSWYEPPKKSPAARKKGKATRKRTIDEVDKAESEEPEEPPAAPEPTVPPLNGTQAIFIDASGDPLAPPSVDARISRIRTNLPVPVPNLIKKSRGRRVPVLAGTGEEESNKRLHVCKVEGCGKCFHRGEHLKRHIRSIHTHEKPFPCTYPSCHKFFNRHDNLLQHVKVHRSGDDDLDAEGSPAPTDSRPGSPLGARASFDPPAAAPLLRHSTAITYPTLGAPMAVSYGPTTQPSSFATNMAVSSLRTELPDSPSKGAPAPRQRDEDGAHEGYAEAVGPQQAPAPPGAQQQQHFAVFFPEGKGYAPEQHYVLSAPAPQQEQDAPMQPVDGRVEGQRQEEEEEEEEERQPQEQSEPQQQQQEQHYLQSNGADVQPNGHLVQTGDPIVQANGADAQLQPNGANVQDQIHAPAPNAPVLQLQPQAFYRLRTPPPPIDMPMHPHPHPHPLPPAMTQAQEWQATFSF